MDINLTMLAGTLAAAPTVREFDSGNAVVRVLVTTRVTEPKRRTDVVPVTLWRDTDPKGFAALAALVGDLDAAGRRVYVSGSIQRRFWDAEEGRRSRLELVASSILVVDPEESLTVAAMATKERLYESQRR